MEYCWIAIACFMQSRVYWSDQLTNSICSADKHNGTMLRVSQRLGSVSPAGLVILHPLLQPAGSLNSLHCFLKAHSDFVKLPNPNPWNGRVDMLQQHKMKCKLGTLLSTKNNKLANVFSTFESIIPFIMLTSINTAFSTV